MMLGNLDFKDIGTEEKMLELESRLIEKGYSRESNCEKNTDTERLTWHIYDIPRQINFSVLSDEIVAILTEYSADFGTRIGVSTEKRV